MTGDPAEPLIPGGLPIHTRSLVVEAFATPSGAVRFAGAILDQRKVGFVPTGGDLQTAGLIHHMQIELELDPESRRITRLATAQPTVAFEASPASGGDCCRDPAPRLQGLVGEALDDGFPRLLAGAFGGPLGCSHLLTLAQLLGASVPRFLEGARLETRAPDERIAKRSLFLDGFEREDGRLDVCIQLSEFRLRPAREVKLPFDRLQQQHEIRIRASLDDQLTLEHLEGAERVRDRSSLDADWRSRNTTLAALEGGPALRGLATRILGELGRDPADGPLRDTLLNLAPGVIQCLAAFAHRLIASFTGGGGGSRASLPRELSVGGYPDSCYMWRSDGPMARARAGAQRRQTEND